MKPASHGPDRKPGGRRFRRRILVVSEFHRRFLATQFVWLLVSVLLLASVVFVPVVVNLLASDEVDPEAVRQFLILDKLILPLIPLVFLVAGFAMVIITHRLAGPLYRFRRVFEDVTDGLLDQRVRLRKNDYLVTEAAALDRMVGSLRAHVAPAQVALADAHRQLKALARRDRVVSGAQLEGLFDSVRLAQASLDHFDAGVEPAGEPAQRAPEAPAEAAVSRSA